MFEEVTFEDVLDRMLDRIDDAYDKRESSPIYAALAPAALEIMNLYAALDDMLEETFADTASREYLIRLAASRGITPRPASNAVVRAVFTPETVEIEMDAEFTSEEATYRVMEKNTDGTYKLECKEAGEAGNTYMGEIIPNDYIEGLETARITEILIYGEEEEDTESIRSKYMDSFEANEFGGNRSDYRKETLKIPGVGAVKVVPVWNGAGTVKLVILNTSHRKASAELLGKVQAIFDPTKDGMGEGIAPIGHIVTVDTVEEIPVQITSDITYDTGYDWNACKIPAEEAVESYLSTVRETWSSQDSSVVRISSINNAILTVQGIIDVNQTRLNGLDSNLELTAYQIPVFGGVDHG